MIVDHPTHVAFFGSSGRDCAPVFFFCNTKHQQGGNTLSQPMELTIRQRHDVGGTRAGTSVRFCDCAGLDIHSGWTVEAAAEETISWKTCHSAGVHPLLPDQRLLT